MFKTKFALQIFVLVLLAIGFQISISAQATRTWVSGVGDDVNPCSRTAPCKTFAGAISKTATNGEINCVDSGGFGALTITKSISIDCSNEIGGILASGTTGITVNITSALDTKKAVRLRGLQINGVNTGISGVRVVSANSLVVENTVIDGFTLHGISIETSANALKISVDNSTIRNNAQHGMNGFLVGSATATISVSDSEFSKNLGNAFNLGVATKIAIQDTSISGNGNGVAISGTDMTLSRCVFIGNGTAVQSNSGTVRLFGNTIVGNVTGLFGNGGSILSYGNNAIDGNTTNGTSTGAVVQN
jgi:hypothetical protein